MTQEQLKMEVPQEESKLEVPREEQTATLCRTKAGNGFKVVVNKLWFYTSKAQVLDLIEGRAKACTFHTITDDA